MASMGKDNTLIKYSITFYFFMLLNLCCNKLTAESKNLLHFGFIERKHTVLHQGLYFKDVCYVQLPVDFSYSGKTQCKAGNVTFIPVTVTHNSP